MNFEITIIIFAILCLNVFFGIVAALPNAPAVFQSGNFESIPPNIYNRTNPSDPTSVVYDSQQSSNSTGGSNPISGIFYWGNYLFNFISLGFIFDFLDSFATVVGITFPAYFLDGLGVLLGFLMVGWIIYMIFGKQH